MLTSLECPISRLGGGMGLHYGTEITQTGQTRSHGTECWKDASEDNESMIVQCGTFSKSLNPRNIDKSVRISWSISSSRLKTVFGYPCPVASSRRRISRRISNRQTGEWSSMLNLLWVIALTNGNSKWLDRYTPFEFL